RVQLSTRCSAPALRAWEGRAPARPQSRGGAELPAAPFRTEGGAPTHNISEKPEPPVGAPAPGANASRRRRSCRQPGSLRGGAPTWGMAQVHGVQPGVKAYPMTPPLLTLYTWRL